MGFRKFAQRRLAETSILIFEDEIKKQRHLPIRGRLGPVPFSDKINSTPQNGIKIRIRMKWRLKVVLINSVDKQGFSLEVGKKTYNISIVYLLSHLSVFTKLWGDKTDHFIHYQGPSLNPQRNS